MLKKLDGLKASVVVGLLVLVTEANAALPAAYTTALGDLEDSVADWAAAVIPVVAAFVALYVGIRVFKKMMSKAA